MRNRCIFGCSSPLSCSQAASTQSCRWHAQAIEILVVHLSPGFFLAGWRFPALRLWRLYDKINTKNWQRTTTITRYIVLFYCLCTSTLFLLIRVWLLLKTTRAWCPRLEKKLLQPGQFDNSNGSWRSPDEFVIAWALVKDFMVMPMLHIRHIIIYFLVQYYCFISNHIHICWLAVPYISIPYFMYYIYNHI